MNVLPNEIRNLIADRLSQAGRARLAAVNKAWRECLRQQRLQSGTFEQSEHGRTSATKFLTLVKEHEVHIRELCFTESANRPFDSLGSLAPCTELWDKGADHRRDYTLRSTLIHQAYACGQLTILDVGRVDGESLTDVAVLFRIPSLRHISITACVSLLDAHNQTAYTSLATLLPANSCPALSVRFDRCTFDATSLDVVCNAVVSLETFAYRDCPDEGDATEAVSSMSEMLAPLRRHRATLKHLTVALHHREDGPSTDHPCDLTPLTALTSVTMAGWSLMEAGFSLSYAVREVILEEYDLEYVFETLDMLCHPALERLGLHFDAQECPARAHVEQRGSERYTREDGFRKLSLTCWSRGIRLTQTNYPNTWLFRIEEPPGYESYWIKESRLLPSVEAKLNSVKFENFLGTPEERMLDYVVNIQHPG